MQDELSIEKARVAILVEERNELLRKVFELEEQVRRLTQRVPDVCPECAGSGKTGSIGLPRECPFCDGTGKRR